MSDVLHQGVILKEIIRDEPSRQDSERVLSVIQPIFDEESALWIYSDVPEPIPLFCDVGVQLTAPVTGIVSYKLVVSSWCAKCGVPGGRISAAVAEDVAWDPEGLSLDRPSVSFVVETDCDKVMDVPASRACQFRGLPSVVTWLRTNRACELPSPMSNAGGVEEAGFSFGLQVRRGRASFLFPVVQ